VIRLTTYAEARDALRRKDLRQALYDDGEALMSGVIVNLHGAEHVARRRLENRLFRRDTFAWFEASLIPEVIARGLTPARAAGRADLLPLARRTMLELSLGVAGIDRRGGTDELDRIDALTRRMARASTVAHATGDREAIVADGLAALDTFAAEFYEPSRARREALVLAHERGEIDETELPRDVLTTLLRNQDRLDLDPHVVRREASYFPWVGAHSTSNQFVHTMHHIFEWLAEHPDDRDRLVDDDIARQRFVHESLRLHPASPVSLRHVDVELELATGLVLPAGELVAIDLETANRDESVFGADSTGFDPARDLPEGVAPWGLSFGHGPHSCLGQELAGGLEPAAVDDRGHHLLGAVAVMAGEVLAAGARPDPDDPAVVDRTTTRFAFERYPVLLG
jgi:cytochrome P450